MKFVLALLFLAALAFAEPEANPAPWYGYWGYPYYIRTGPKHTWVDGYGYAIVGAKEPAAAERKKREADPAPWHYGYWGYPYGYYGRKTTWVDGYGYAITGRKKRESDPAVLGSQSSAPPQPLTTPYLGHPLVGGLPHSATVEHKGTEVIPGAVAAGESIPGATVYAGHYGYGLPLYGRKKREAEAEAEADPESWYYGYYGHHLGYYGGYYGYPYGYGYYYGK